MELTQEQLQQITELAKSIDMCSIISSNISAIGYDKDNFLLKVIFKNNSTYLYLGVEPEIWESLCKAESRGKYIREAVTSKKDKYKYLKLL